MTNLESYFKKGLELHHFTNTAYPLKPTSFRQYRIKDPSEVDQLITRDLSSLEDLSLYIHIPFCEKRCVFCEYSVVSSDEAGMEDVYIKALVSEISRYGGAIGKKKIRGFDVGGGTPLILKPHNLEKITRAMYDSFSFGPETGLSIETTPVIASEELEKLKLIHQLGYRRISMGIQTIDPKLLEDFERKGSVGMIQKAVEHIREAGFKRFNVDLMYGFLNQTDEAFKATIEFAISLKPEYITLYRNRYKGTKLEYEAKSVGLEKVNRQYRIAFDLLNSHGYKANMGKNTFTAVDGDVGTSEYLTTRVIDGTPYLGMGLGAQSMGGRFLSYNQGAASKKLGGYLGSIEKGHFPLQDFYILPEDEMIAKMVSVAFYFGYIDLVAFEKRFGLSFDEHFKDEISFLASKGLMKMDQNRFILTEKGGDYLNGIIPLFYSKRSKQELLEMEF